jgi:hypothetical protein
MFFGGRHAGNMNKTLPAFEYVQIGMLFNYVLNPLRADALSYRDRIDKLIARLELCDLPVTRNVCTPLQAPITYNDQTKQIDPIVAQRLDFAVDIVRKALDKETFERKTIVLDQQGVSSALRELPSKIQLTEVQAGLLEETIVNVECGAFRSAIVMSWNLAFDYIRNWMFNNHLQSFNTHLTKSHVDKNGDPKFALIADEADFERGDAPGEGVVLSSMYGAKIIGGAIYDHLKQYLRIRNDYAHANTRPLTRDQANAYAENLIGLISQRPFVSVGVQNAVTQSMSAQQTPQP